MTTLTPPVLEAVTLFPVRISIHFSEGRCGEVQFLALISMCLAHISTGGAFLSESSIFFTLASPLRTPTLPLAKYGLDVGLAFHRDG